MGRIGKIARLPREVRDELNVRLQNGVVAHRLVDWLNGLESVRAVLAEHFGGSPVNEPNITAWRSSGFARWNDAEQTRRLAYELRKDGFGTDPGKSTECMEMMLVLKMAELSRLLRNEKTPQKQWKRLCQLNQQLSLLRRGRCAEVRQQINREQWERGRHQT